MLKSTAMFTLVLLLFPACSTETHEIAPKWSAGDTRTIVYTSDRESQMSIGGGASFSTAARSEIWLDLEITAVDSANAATMQVTFQRAELNETVTANGTTFVPFAGEDGASPLQKMYTALADQTFTATISANGRVTSIDGIDAIVDRLRDAAPATGGMAPGMEVLPQQLKELTDTFAEVFDETATTGMLETVFHVYPDGPVRIGDSWTTETMDAFGGSDKPVSTKWTLKSIENGLIHLTFASSFDVVEGEYGESNSGSGSGTATIDASTGLMTGLTATIKNVMENDADGASVRDEATQQVTIEMF